MTSDVAYDSVNSSDVLIHSKLSNIIRLMLKDYANAKTLISTGFITGYTVLEMSLLNHEFIF